MAIDPSVARVAARYLAASEMETTLATAASWVQEANEKLHDTVAILEEREMHKGPSVADTYREAQEIANLLRHQIGVQLDHMARSLLAVKIKSRGM